MPHLRVFCQWVPHSIHDDTYHLLALLARLAAPACPAPVWALIANALCDRFAARSRAHGAAAAAVAQALTHEAPAAALDAVLQHCLAPAAPGAAAADRELALERLSFAHTCLAHRCAAAGDDGPVGCCAAKRARVASACAGVADACAPLLEAVDARVRAEACGAAGAALACAAPGADTARALVAVVATTAAAAQRYGDAGLALAAVRAAYRGVARLLDDAGPGQEWALPLLRGVWEALAPLADGRWGGVCRAALCCCVRWAGAARAALPVADHADFQSTVLVPGLQRLLAPSAPRGPWQWRLAVVYAWGAWCFGAPDPLPDAGAVMWAAVEDMQLDRDEIVAHAAAEVCAAAARDAAAGVAPADADGARLGGCALALPRGDLDTPAMCGVAPMPTAALRALFGGMAVQMPLETSVPECSGSTSLTASVYDVAAATPAQRCACAWARGCVCVCPHVSLSESVAKRRQGVQWPDEGPGLRCVRCPVECSPRSTRPRGLNCCHRSLELRFWCFVLVFAVFKVFVCVCVCVSRGSPWQAARRLDDDWVRTSLECNIPVTVCYRCAVYCCIVLLVPLCCVY